MILELNVKYDRILENVNGLLWALVYLDHILFISVETLD